MDLPQRDLQTDVKLFFKFLFEFLADNRKILKRIAIDA